MDRITPDDDRDTDATLDTRFTAPDAPPLTPLALRSSLKRDTLDLMSVTAYTAPRRYGSRLRRGWSMLTGETND
jgi:hypothetical protein